jgi:hypothetical protein
MRRLWVTLVLSGALGAALLAAPGQAAEPSGTDCGKLGIKGHVFAEGVGCSQARSIVKSFLKKSQSQGSDAIVQGFSCHGSTPGRKMAVKCSRGDQRVRWKGAIS